MRSSRIAIGTAAAVFAAVCAAAPAAQATNIGTEGCTPGYWKNHTESWEEYWPTMRLKYLFTLPAELSAYADVTMLQALSFKGGSGNDGAARILLRAAVAAHLNAAHEGVGYPYRRAKLPGNLRATIDAALASGDREQMLQVAAWLDEANNLGCPLS